MPSLSYLYLKFTYQLSYLSLKAIKLDGWIWFVITAHTVCDQICNKVCTTSTHRFHLVYHTICRYILYIVRQSICACIVANSSPPPVTIKICVTYITCICVYKVITCGTGEKLAGNSASKPFKRTPIELSCISID